MEELFFIAVVPPHDIRDEIMSLKKSMAENYGSRKALNSPPHITLHMPFKIKENKLSDLISELNYSVEGTEYFNLQLNGFGFFEPRVVFVKVEKSFELDELQKRVIKAMKRMNQFNANYKDRPFHPHMTIAFQDLKKEKFWLAQTEFVDKNYTADFKVEGIELLKHDGRMWQLYQKISF